MAEWLARWACNRRIASPREFEPRQGLAVVSLSKKLYPHCLVLVGSQERIRERLDKLQSFLRNRTKINLYRLSPFMKLHRWTKAPANFNHIKDNIS